MKTIELENGQIIEEYNSIKEIKSLIEMGYVNNKEFLADDYSLFIGYKDGSTYYLSGVDEDGKYKKTGIKTVIENNPCTYSVYGEYELYKVDDEEPDDDCTWLVR